MIRPAAPASPDERPVVAGRHGDRAAPDAARNGGRRIGCRPSRRRGLVAAVLAVALLLAACGNGDTDVDTGTPAPTVTATDTIYDPGPTGTPTQPTPVTPTAPEPGGTDDDMVTPSDSIVCRPGAHETQSCEADGGRFDYERCQCVLPTVPWEGVELDVVGVALDDVLNFRSEPNPSASIVARVQPDPVAVTPATIVSAGTAATYGDAVWWKATVDGTEAWANSRFLGVLGATDDAFDELAATMSSLSAPTIEELAAELAAARAGGATAVVVELFGDDAISSQAWVDVMDLGDDAVRGERFHLSLRNLEDETPRIIGFEITGAARTLICGRGIDYAGRCV